jgi:DNA phosphorothioation-dependent restriction protein DptH
MLSDVQSALISKALKKILGDPSEGTIAYIRCFGPQLIRSLCESSRCNIAGWTIWGVIDNLELSKRLITADYAVEVRENKQDSVVFLVDIATAGAGMDGIYSSAREIGEKEFFDIVNEEARKMVPHGFLNFCRKAVSKARRIGGQNTISPWRVFEFYSTCSDATSISSGLALLGLWPIQFNGKPDINDIDKSIRVLERLVLRSSSDTTAESKVDGLILVDPTEEQRRALIEFVRESTKLSLFDAIAALHDKPNLWLNNLKPGIFAQDTLQKIEIVPWRGKNDRPMAWSGLTLLDETGRLRFILDPNQTATKKQSKLEIRWKGLPDELNKGAADYTVTILSGEEELAEKKVSHTGKNPQKCSFTIDDFELEEGAKFEAIVSIRAIGNDDIEEKTEDFLLLFGNAPDKSKSSSGAIVRALVEGAIAIDSKDDFANACSNSHSFGRDSKGFITFRHEKKTAKVYCPSLLFKLEQDWWAKKGPIGRWEVSVRNDGSLAGELKFIPLAGEATNPAIDRLFRASADLSQIAGNGQGLMGIIHGFNKSVEEYINAWLAATDTSPSNFALVNTLEVKSVSGSTIGLIVLPHHPLRLSWHYAYDQLLIHFRYEENISVKKLQEIGKSIDGAHFPAFLPGLSAGESFVFGDNLGFYTVAMVSDKDREPKASIAILAKTLSDGKEELAPSIGQSTSNILAVEISRFMLLHPSYKIIHLHALRPGDGMTIGRSMGTALDIRRSLLKEDDEMDDSNKISDIGFVLELYPSEQKTGITGKFFSSIAERKRTGSGYLQQDSWILDNYNRSGKITLPRLSWAKRDYADPQTSAHLSIAFDTFDSRVIPLPIAQLEGSSPLEVYGLSASLVRNFSFSPQPVWKTYLSLNVEGEKHPASRAFTERIIKVHAAIMKSTSRNLSESADVWPLLRTEIPAEKEDSIRILHKLSDWVVTIDRNAGVEYFDSPKEKSAVYDAYIIDCVPEREDLGFLQLVTSTSNFDEIVNLLDNTLAEMGLSSSPRNCLFFLTELKALSGRFAMRLAGAGNQPQEMIALAMTHSNCRGQLKDNQDWFSLNEGFFIPLDDVPHLLGIYKEEISAEAANNRADLLYVTASKRSGLQFAFVEIKFRRYLKTARSTDLIATIAQQLKNSRHKWEALYGPEVNPIERAIRRGRLARILNFYANKGRRHYLSEDAYQQISKEIERMIREGEKYSFPVVGEQTISDKGYVFCPEYTAEKASRISYDDDPIVLLFGSNQLPDPPVGSSLPVSRPTDEGKPNSAVKEDMTATAAMNDTRGNVNEEAKPHHEKAIITLGHGSVSQETVDWTIAIRSNPHLMMVGLPGMGKTTSLINICSRMVANGINPIVFSYHDDIDEKLSARLSNDLQCVDYAGLGFNPLQVVTDNPIGYIDNISMLRDIFASIFPDLGDIQLGRLREALKQSYLDRGWGDREADRQYLELPEFHTFFTILKSNSKDKADKGLLTRLGELDDYGFFQNTSGRHSLLDINKPALIRIHQTHNEVLQQAFATFVLHNLYQQMFIRGVQNNITHAIIFDEAHRAARLKLIPTMTKECRKYGISFVLASQEVKDFDQSLFNAVANYLVLRLNENDAKIVAKLIAPSDQVNRYADRIKQMPKYHALFFGEANNKATYIELQK